MTALPDPECVAHCLRKVATEAILPRFQDLAVTDVREKTPGDLVTVADDASEAALERALVPIVPGSVVVGEEAVAADPVVLDRLTGGAPVWVVDPLDGTRFFANGETGFTVIVALAQGGVTHAGWIYDPVADSLAYGARGQGAWLDGMPCRVADPGSLAALTAHFSTPAAPAAWKRQVRQRASERLAAVGRSLPAGLSYRRLLGNHHHVAFFQKLAPWDHAAGTLLYREAGGTAALLSGRAFSLTGGEPSSDDGLLLAPSPARWYELAQTIFARAEGD